MAELEFCAVPYVVSSRPPGVEDALLDWLDGNVWQRAPKDHGQIVRYLCHGRVQCAIPSIRRDPFDEAIIGHPYQDAFVTDGVWIWNQTIAYWVDHYYLKLPASFLKHIRRQKHQIPKKAEINLAAAQDARRVMHENRDFDFENVSLPQ